MTYAAPRLDCSAGGRRHYSKVFRFRLLCWTSVQVSGHKDRKVFIVRFVECAANMPDAFAEGSSGSYSHSDDLGALDFNAKQGLQVEASLRSYVVHICSIGTGSVKTKFRVCLLPRLFSPTTKHHVVPTSHFSSLAFGQPPCQAAVLCTLQPPLFI